MPNFGGGSVDRLAINNTLTLAGTTAMDLNKAAGTNDAVVGLTTVIYGGTLVVTNFGSALQCGDTFTLFVAENYIGEFASLNLPPLDQGLAWDTSKLAVNGSISVATPLLITTQPASLTVVEGADATFTVEATGCGTLTYAWYANGSPIANATGPSYTKARVTLSDSGAQYYVVVSDASGSVPSGTATLSVMRDTVAPRVLSAAADCVSNQVCLTFSEPVDPLSATMASNYSIDNGVTVDSAVFLPPDVVCLFTDPLTPGVFYTLTINNVMDLAAVPNQIAPNSQITFACPTNLGSAFTKANNMIPLNQPASWVNNALPGASEYAVWDSTVEAANTTNSLGDSLSWGGISILNPSGPVTLTGGGSNTLTLNGVSGIGIDMSGASQDLTVNCPVTVAGNQTWTVGAGRTLSMKSVDLSGVVQIGGQGSQRINEMHALAVYPCDFTGSSYAEVGSFDGPGSLVQSGPGVLALTGKGSYSGSTTVSKGTLRLVATDLNRVAGVCSALGTNNLWMGPGTTLELRSDWAVNFAGGARPIFSGNVTLEVGAVTPGISNQTIGFALDELVSSNATLNITGTNGVNVALGVIRTRGGALQVVKGPGLKLELAGICTNGIYPADFQGSSYGSPSEIEWNFGDGGKDNTTIGPITRVSRFTTSGNGPVLLWATNTIDGPTFVSNGVLVVSGSMSGGSPVTVYGGILSGSGRLDGPVTVQAGGMLSPGNGIGTMTVNNTLLLAGTALMQLNRTNGLMSDQVNGIATLTYGGELLVTNCGPALEAGDTFTLFIATNYTGAFAVMSLPALSPGLGWDTSQLSVNGSIRVAANSLTYAGLLHSRLGNATLSLQSNQLTVANLGSSGQDGVAIWLGSPWAPNGFDWLTRINYLGDASQHIGGTLSLSLKGTRSDSLSSISRATYTNPIGDGIEADYDFSGAYANGPITVNYWLNGVLVASDQVINNQVSLVFSDWPTTFGLTLSGPYLIRRAQANDTGPYGQSHSNMLDAGIVAHPWRVRRLGVWIDIDAIEIVAPTDAALSDVMARLQGGGGGISSVTLTNETLSSAGVTVEFAGLEHTSLGHATLNVASNKLIVANIGSSGVDGVTIAIPTNAVGWSAQWQPLDPDGTLPVGAYLQEQIIGTGGPVTNGLLGRLTVTKAGTGNYVLSADVSLMAASSLTVKVYSGTTLLAQTNQTGGVIGSFASCPTDVDSSSDDPREWQVTGHPACSFTLNNGPTVLADSVRIIPEGVAGLRFPAAVRILASQVPSITITNESLAVGDVWSGGFSGDWDIGITTNWTSAGSPATYMDGDWVTFDDTAIGPTAVNLTRTLSPGGVSVNNSALNYSFTGSGKISGTASLTKSGAATLTLLNANDYTGVTTVSGGTLELQATGKNTASGVCGAVGATTLNLADGASMKLAADGDTVFGSGSRFAATNASVTLSAGPLTPGQINHALTLAPAGLTLANVTVTVRDYGDTLALGPIKVSGPVFFAGSGKLAIQSMTDPGIYPADFMGSSYTAVGPVSGQLSVAQTGPGTLALTGANTYSGGTTVSHGTLILAGDNSAASGATYVGPGATLQLQATVNNTVGGACFALGTNTLWLASGSALALLADTNANFTGGAPPALEGNVSLYAASLTAGGSNQTLAFGLSGIDTTNVTVTLSSANPITVQLGSMRLRNGPLVVVADPGVYVDLAGIRTNGIYPADFQGFSYGSPSEIEWDFGDGSANNTSRCGPIQGVSWFTKDGNAALILWATNSYPGPTVVSNGVLVVSGRIEGGGAVTVYGGVLGGSGSLDGTVTVQAGGMLSPGNSIGTMTVNNTLTLAAGSTTMMQLNKAGATNDQVRGITTLTYGGMLEVTNLAGTLAAGDSFKLFDATNYTGAFAAISPATPGIGIVWDSSYLPVDGTLRVAAVPPERPPIQVTFTGGLPVLAWPSGCTLQSANSLLGPWSAVPGAVSPYTVVPIDPTKFYRLVLGP